MRFSQYDDISGAIRRDQIIQADREYQERVNQQGAIAKSLGEDLAQAVLSADLDDTSDLYSTLKQLEVVYHNARIFLLEALENKRLRRSLNGP